MPAASTLAAFHTADHKWLANDDLTDVAPNIAAYLTGGATGVAGPLAAAGVPQSATALAVITGGTIPTGAGIVERVSPAAAVTGVILTPGTVTGQTVTVVNEAIAANSVTMAAAGTSNVADGVTTVIPGLRASTFTWDTGTSLWYRAA
jgi:hypothetical protein